MEIFLWLGMSKNVMLVDICEFNPSVEDYESSLVIVNLLYYFLMGWTRRQK
jgi:arginase family enzyme